MEQGVIKLASEGYAFIKDGRISEALRIFEQVNNMDAHNTDAWNTRGVLHSRLGEPQQAIKCFRKVIDIDASRPEPWRLLGEIFWNAGQFVDAEKSYRRAADLLPDSVDVRMGLATVLMAQGKQDETLALCREVLSLDPQDVETCLRLGTAFQARRHYDDAEKSYLKAVQLVPERPAAYNGLAGVMLGQARFSEALDWCSKALQVDPSYADAHISMATALLLTGSELKRLTLKKLDEDRLYTSMEAPRESARILSEEYGHKNPEAQKCLVNLFREFDPEKPYSLQWWQEKLAGFGRAVDGHDKIARGVFSAVYSWSIPTAEALSELAEIIGNDEVRSYGAGRGYWELLLQTCHGVKIIASDTARKHRFLDLEIESYDTAQMSETGVVLLSWIPRGEPSAESLLHRMKSGQKLVLIGVPADSRGVAQMCATSHFFKLLAEQFRLVKHIPLAQFSYINDSVDVYCKQ